MNKKSIKLTIILLLVLLLLCPVSIGTETVNTHTITINEGTDDLEVSESLTILGDTDEYYETISFWIPTENTELTITVDGKNPNYISMEPTDPLTGIATIILYNCNLSGLNILKNKSVDIEISYKLNADLNEFQSALNYDTDSLTIYYKNEEIYEASYLSKDIIYSVKLSEDTASTTTIYKDADATLYLAIIGILIVLLIVVFVSSKKTGIKSTSPKPTDTKTASKEYLETKKEHLMESLKDIEKKHRAKKISDETYHKLKDRYKQEAVDTMKKLEDIK